MFEFCMNQAREKYNKCQYKYIKKGYKEIFLFLYLGKFQKSTVRVFSRVLSLLLNSYPKKHNLYMNIHLLIYKFMIILQNVYFIPRRGGGYGGIPPI